MKNEDIMFNENEQSSLKKIIIWIIVIGISLMLVLTILFQPKFFTFVQ